MIDLASYLSLIRKTEQETLGSSCDLQFSRNGWRIGMGNELGPYLPPVIGAKIPAHYRLLSFILNATAGKCANILPSGYRLSHVADGRSGPAHNCLLLVSRFAIEKIKNFHVFNRSLMAKHYHLVIFFATVCLPFGDLPKGKHAQECSDGN